MNRPTNYLQDTNPFQLAGPPTYWLRQLWTYDPSLVVIPSRQGFYYRLAQRRRLNLPMRITNDTLWKESDTRMLARHGLIPVTTIVATANWSNPLIWVELSNRAPWRMGGAAKVNALLEKQEHQDRQARDQQVSDQLDYVARDAWNFYQMKTGVRSHMWSPRSSPVVPIEPAKPKKAGLVLPSMFVRNN